MGEEVKELKKIFWKLRSQEVKEVKTIALWLGARGRKKDTYLIHFYPINTKKIKIGENRI